jgi:hypothetical protein
VTGRGALFIDLPLRPTPLYLSSHLVLSNHHHHFQQIDDLGPFLSLPRELRDEIYALVIVIHDPKDRRILRIHEDSTPHRPPPALLLSCKQVYVEARLFYIKCLKLVISNDACLEFTQQWLARQQLQAARKELQAIAFANVAIFRAFSPRERCPGCKILEKISGVRQPRIRIFCFSRSDSSTARMEVIPEVSRFLLSLAGLRHIEISMTTKSFSDPAERAKRSDFHEHDFQSLTTTRTLETVTFSFDCEGGGTWKSYRDYRDDDAGPIQRRVHHIIEGGRDM